MEGIIGRKKEQKELEQVYNSNKAEFAVVYGRRRVGKTYLVREFFQDRLDFYHTALYQNFKPYSLLKKVGREVTLATVGQEHNHVLACTSGTT